MSNLPKEPNQRPAKSVKCLVAGSGLKLAAKKLKIAFPKKKQEQSSTIVISGGQRELVFGLPGASVGVPAMCTAAFTCQIPWQMFKLILLSTTEDAALHQFEFAPGWFKQGSIVTRSASVILQFEGHDAFSANLQTVEEFDFQVSDTPNTKNAIKADPTDAPLGLPLIAAYAYIKKYGIKRLIANQEFAAQQVEVDQLLNKAHRLLAPVGISRNDLEKLMDQKYGLTRISSLPNEADET